MTDQPFGDTPYAHILVSQFAREHVTVALSGDGGDEGFLGYGIYLGKDLTVFSRNASALPILLLRVW